MMNEQDDLREALNKFRDALLDTWLSRQLVRFIKWLNEKLDGGTK